MGKFIISLKEEDGSYELKEIRGLINRDEMRSMIIISCTQYNSQIKKILTKYSIDHGIKGLCQDVFLPYDFIDEYEERLSKYWETIIASNVLTEEMIVKYFDKISKFLMQIISFQRVSEQFLEDNIDLIDENPLHWRIISTNQSLSEEFMLKYFDKIEWIQAIANFDLTNKILTKVCRTYKINEWELLIKKQHVTEDFIEEFADLIPWDYLIGHRKVSDSKIKKFEDLIFSQHLTKRKTRNIW